MKKFVSDLLKTSGKWSFKRVTAFYMLNIAIVYAFLPILIGEFNVQEFVFWGFLTYSAGMVGMVLKQKLSSTPTTEEVSKEPLTFEKDE